MSEKRSSAAFPANPVNNRSSLPWIFIASKWNPVIISFSRIIALYTIITFKIYKIDISGAKYSRRGIKSPFPFKTQSRLENERLRRRREDNEDNERLYRRACYGELWLVNNELNAAPVPNAKLIIITPLFFARGIHYWVDTKEIAYLS